MKVKIENSIQEDKAVIKVFCPYDNYFIKGAGNSSGKFSHSENCWIFPARSEAKARALLLDVFGTDDTATSQKVDVRVTFPSVYYVNRDAIRLAGRLIARATCRDSKATLGDDVELVSGWVHGGGSAKNWDTRTSEGSVYEIFEFEASKIETLRALDFIEVEVIGGEPVTQETTLKEIANETPIVSTTDSITVLEFSTLKVTLNSETKTVDFSGAELLMSKKDWESAYEIFNKYTTQEA